MTLDPLRLRRLLALDAALDAVGYAGSRVFAADVPTVRIDPPHAQAQAVIDGWDWTDAGDLATQRVAAVDLAVSGADAMALGVRAAAAALATRANSQAEVLRSLIGLCGFTHEQVAERVALDRLTHPPTPGAPEPAEAVTLSTTRLGAGTVVAMVAAYIAGGAGDPTG